MTLHITGHSITVTACWIVGLVFAVVDVLYVTDWAALSSAFLILAASLTVKRAVNRYAANWTQAYEVGKERGEAEVRKIR